MAAKSLKSDGPAIVVLFYPDDTKITIRGVVEFLEHEDGTLVLKHGDIRSKVRPDYRLYQIMPDDGEESDD